MKIKSDNKTKFFFLKIQIENFEICRLIQNEIPVAHFGEFARQGEHREGNSMTQQIGYLRILTRKNKKIVK